MSICPVPASSNKTDYTNPGSFTGSAPDAKFELCVGGSQSIIVGPGTVVTQTICCPSPGPMGPAGSDGEDGVSLVFVGEWAPGTAYHFQSGDPRVTDMVSHGGNVYICKVVHTSDSSNEPGVGVSWTTDWDLFVATATDRMRWMGSWADATAYAVNDTVMGTDGNGYVCIAAHTSELTNQPNGESAYGDDFWAPITDIINAIPPEQKSFLEQLQDGIFDWVKDKYAKGDWWSLLAAGIGIVAAGAIVYDMMSDDGEGDGNASSQYDGTPGYNGSFATVTLQDAVESIMLFCDFDPSEFDVSALPTTPVLFTLNSGTSSRDLLNQLQLAYQFDIVSSQGTVKFVPKYQTSVRTLTLDDLGHTANIGDDMKAVTQYTATRYQGIDLPRSVSVTYYSAELDGKQFTQVSAVDTYGDGQDVTLNVPFTLSDLDAHRIAETTLVNAHLEQQEFKFTTDYHNLDIEPGDVIDVPFSNGTSLMTVRVSQQTETDEGILENTCSRCSFNTIAYTGSGAVVNSPPQVINQPVDIGYSATMPIEVPPLTSDDSKPRVYAVVHGYGKAGWPGASVYRSVDSGVSYGLIASTSSIANFGMAATPIANPPGGIYHVWDDTSTVDVELKTGSLTSLTDIAVLNGQNWAMLGTELIGFVNATLIAPNTYRLSRLLRGRQGTEQSCGTHVNNEIFAVIDNNLQKFEYPVDAINKLVTLKTVTIGSDLSKASPYSLQSYALNMRPWAVAQPKITKQINGDFYVEWLERPRLRNALMDESDVFHDDDWGGFALQFMDLSNTPKQQYITMTQNYTYTVAQQITDFGSQQSSLKVSIAQLSKVIGGGYKVTLTGA